MIITGLRSVFFFFIRPRRRGFAWYDLVMLMILATATIITFVKPSFAPAPHALSTSIIPATSSAEKSHTYTGGYRYRADIAAPPCNDSDLACYGGTQQPNAQGHITTPVSTNNFFFIFTDPALTVQQKTGIVQQIWGWTLGIVDAFVVLVLMLNGLKVILAGTVFGYTNAIESLPGALLSLIASHASMVFITAILALNNILAVGLYNTANSAAWTDPANTQTKLTLKTCSSWYSNVNKVFGVMSGSGPAIPVASGASKILGWVGGQIECNGQQQYDRADATATVDNTVQGIPKLTGLSAIFDSITNLLSFLTGMLILVIVGQMILRIFLINFYAVLAPLGIACWALPGKVGQPVTQQWFKGFISIVMAQFAQVVALIIGQVFSAAVITYMAKIPSLTDAMTQDTTLVLVIAITRLWFIIRIPGLFETAPTRAMGDIAHTITQAAGTAMAMQMVEAQFVFSAVTSAIGVGAAGGAALAL